jgi:dipeptidyl aminopeptidase/acylaminoacyl peptidase
MAGEINLTEKYERNGWPSLSLPDHQPPDGWNLSLLTGVDRIYNHSLSPDGKTVAFIRNHEHLAEVHTLPVSGGWPARLTTNRTAIQYWWDEIPRWSADGAWLAFCIDGHAYVTPSNGSSIPQKISDFTSSASSPVWMPDNQGLILSIERQGTIHLLLTDRQGNWPTQLTSGPGNDSDARPSPDGRQIAYVHAPLDDLNRREIRLVDLAAHETRSIVCDIQTRNWSPSWSPDGACLAFLSQRSGFNEIWLMDPHGPHTAGVIHSNPRQLTHAGLDLADISWSPDGRYLAATANRGGALDLGLVDVEDGSLHTLRQTQGVHMRPNWSPDGSFLTFEYMAPLHPPDIYRLELKKTFQNRLEAGDLVQLTFSNLPALKNLPLVEPELVSYPSFDGLVIHGLLYIPLKPNGAAVVRPHGGPRDQYGYEWDILAQYLVAKGYTFLAINYRGSTGYGTSFEHANDNNWGIGDTQDCFYGANYLSALGWVDPQRISILGSSYGGYMVACCLSRDSQYRFACGVSLYGDASLISSWAQCESDTRLYTEMMIGHPAVNRQVYQAGSPVLDVARVQKPVLILHGLEDKIVPPQASEEWVEALRRADKVFEYKTYASESHGFLSHANLLDEYQRIERFLDWYLLPRVPRGAAL